jgi:TolB-like protein
MAAWTHGIQLGRRAFNSLADSLTHVPGLKVIARTSAFAFKGQHTDIRKIAEALGVSNIFEGRRQN